jgi:CRP/FNR family transcriptional regulator, cyclic AMP receptor protein
MTMPNILDSFASHEFLKNLKQRHLMKLAQGAKPFAQKTGEFLARVGTTSPGLWLIKSGKVEIDIRRPDQQSLALQTLGPGEIVGWSWVVPPYQSQFDCKVMEDVSGLFFDGHWLREQCEQDHELGYYLLRQTLAVLSSRAAATRMQLLGGTDAGQRRPDEDEAVVQYSPG